MYQCNIPHYLVQFSFIHSFPSPDVPIKEVYQSINLQVTTTIGRKTQTKPNKPPQEQTLGVQVYFQASECFTTLGSKTSHT